MKRDYSTSVETKVDFFTGQEVEYTPAFGTQTLFVVGLQTVDDIQTKINHANKIGAKIEHIYFGANQSFPSLLYNDYNGWKQWEDMIMPFLEAGYWCTLDLDVGCVTGLTDGLLCEQDKFIPMISVKIPYARTLGYNAVVKIDDRDFKATNPGVWCHSLHDLQRRSKFTDWGKYTKDEILK